MDNLIKDLNFKAAKERLEPVLLPTHLIYSDYFSKETGNDIYLKPENLQRTGSFKIRGAYNKISKLTDEERARGLVTASAGNHAQGVAYSARETGAKATICMPKKTPVIKVNRTRSYGVDVVLVGDTFDEANAHSLKLAKEEGYTLVHPFDDYDVIEGQGTIALEVLEDLPDADLVLVPVGGGGLISGVAAAVKSIDPTCQVWGVESTQIASMANAISKGQAVKLEGGQPSIADGTAVLMPGKKTFEYASKYVDNWVQVDDLDLMTVFTEMVENHKLVVEPSGLLAVAAAKKIPVHNKKIVALMSGGNIDMLTIANIVNRGLIRQGRIFTFSTKLINSPGKLVSLLNVISNQGGNIIDVIHDTHRANFQLNEILVTISVEVNGFEHINLIKKALTDNNYEFEAN